MQNEWILDVLSDLRAFAERNGLSRLAEEFDLTRRRAALELAALDGRGGTEAAGRSAQSAPGLDS